MSALWFDLRFALRLLSRAPGFAGLCVMVIAVALSLSLTIYVMVRNNGLEPLPLPDGDRYVALQHVLQDSGMSLRGDQFHLDTLQALQARSQSFELLGGARLHGSLTVNDGEITEAPWGADISAALMRATGVEPLLGRMLTEADAQLDAPPVALVGYDFWQSFFGGRDDIVGYRARIDGEMHTIIGVMPEGFRYPTDHHVWRPLKMQPNHPPGDHSQHVTPIGILKPGVSLAAVSREVAAIVADLQAQYPDDYENMTAQAIPYVDAASATEFGVMNVVMLFAGASILLLACLNVGNLLLVRASERNHELVIRSALGGSRGRIVRQILFESLLICLAGGALGLWLGSFGARFVQYQTEVVVGSTYLPFWMRFDLSADALLVAVLSIAIIWLLAGGIPAWRASGATINTVLSGGNKGVARSRNSRTTAVLVAAEVVFSFFLLILSGAFVATVHTAAAMEFGVATENRVAGLFLFEDKHYDNTEKRMGYFNALVRELESEPGVRSATFTSALPGMGWAISPFDLAGGQFAASGELPRLQFIPVDYQYMEKMGIGLQQGRLFDVNDREGSLPVAIIQQEMAERYWPGESPLGKRLMVNPEDEKSALPKGEYTIVGVIDHVDQGQTLGRWRGIVSVYVPMAQRAPGFGYVVTHFEELPADPDQFVRRVISRVDRDIAFNTVRPLNISLSLNVRMLQTMSELFVAVALIALVLAGTGIYGVVSRSVLLRTREMGIRRALGQTDLQTLLFFLREGAYFLLAGALIGGAGAVAAAWLLTSEFPSLVDSIVSIVIIIFVLMTVLVLGASYLPARRMLGMEPAVALHHE